MVGILVIHGRYYVRFGTVLHRDSLEKLEYKRNSKASDSLKNILTFIFSESIRSCDGAVTELIKQPGRCFRQHPFGF